MHLSNIHLNSKKRISGWISSCTWFVVVFNPAGKLLSLMESVEGAHTLCGSQLQDFWASAQKSSLTECWLPQSISMIQEVTCVNRGIIITLIKRTVRTYYLSLRIEKPGLSGLFSKKSLSSVDMKVLPYTKLADHKDGKNAFVEIQPGRTMVVEDTKEGCLNSFSDWQLIQNIHKVHTLPSFSEKLTKYSKIYSRSTEPQSFKILTRLLKFWCGRKIVDIT